MAILIDKNTSICTQYEEGNEFTNDLGTALVSMAHDVIGIASWTYDFENMKLNVYTAVYPFITWIETLIKEHQ